MRKAALWTILLVLVIFLVSAQPVAAAAPRYTCKALPPMPGYPSNVNQPTCLNNLAQVSGYAQGPKQAFLYTSSSGSMQALGTLTAPYTYSSAGYGINDAGQVVGRSDAVTYGLYHAFLYTPGSTPSMLDLVGLTGFTDASVANGINNAGKVVGTCKNNSSGYTRAFLYTPFTPPDTPSTMQDLGGLNATIISSASAINAAGQVVGNSKSGGSPSISRAFLYTPGSPSTMDNLGTLPPPYDYQCYAAGINAAGQVVGYCWSSSNAYRAWVYRGGVMTDLSSLVVNLPSEVTISMASAINDRGQIITSASDGRGYLLTPVPVLAGVDLLLD